MDRVPVEIDIDGMCMTADAWRDLQDSGDTSLINEIEKQAMDMVVERGKKFFIYDPSNEGEILKQCDSRQEVEELFKSS